TEHASACSHFVNSCVPNDDDFSLRATSCSLNQMAYVLADGSREILCELLAGRFCGLFVSGVRHQYELQQQESQQQCAFHGPFSSSDSFQHPGDEVRKFSRRVQFCLLGFLVDECASGAEQ